MTVIERESSGPGDTGDESWEGGATVVAARHDAPGLSRCTGHVHLLEVIRVLNKL